MRKVIPVLTVCMFVLTGMVMAQKSKPTKDQPQTPPQTQPQTTTQAQPSLETEKAREMFGSHFFKKYSIATRWNDAEEAKSALLDLIVEYSGNDSLVFSLAVYYYEHQNNASAVLVCQDLLARNPKNAEALELSALGYENLGINDRALQNYESLYLLLGNMNTLYKMAFLQYHLKKYPESLTNIDIILAKPEATTTKVTYNDKDEKPKEYILKVALLNLKGMVYKDQGDKINAKKYFDESLAAAPDFILAKKNLEELSKK